MRDLLIKLLLSGGTFFLVVGAIGLIRLPDLFTRIHATTKCDTLGAGLILMALMIHEGVTPPTLKLLLIFGFLWLSNPTGSHLLARAIYRSSQIPVETIDLTGERKET